MWPENLEKLHKLYRTNHEHTIVHKFYAVWGERGTYKFKNSPRGFAQSTLKLTTLYRVWKKARRGLEFLGKCLQRAEIIGG